MKKNYAAARPYLRGVTLKRAEVDSFDRFPYNVPALREFEALEIESAVTFFVGENGSGKSTLLEAIAMALGFGVEGGTMNVRIEGARDTTDLYKHLRLIKGTPKPTDYYFLRAESFHQVATYMDSVGYLGGYGNKSLHHRSHGEAFMSVLTEKLRGQGLYIFDEPEAALSPSRQLSALVAINDLVCMGSQFIIATHSPILMAYPGAKILSFSECGITPISYEDTEHYSITRDFLNNYKGMLRHLLA